MNISWQSFCSLLFRIYVVPLFEEDQKEAERKETERKANDDAQLQPVASSPASPVPAMASTLLAHDALVVRQYSNLLSVIRVIHIQGVYMSSSSRLASTPSSLPVTSLFPVGTLVFSVRRRQHVRLFTDPLQGWGCPHCLLMYSSRILVLLIPVFSKKFTSPSLLT